MPTCKVTVIVPTTAQRSRFSEIQRCIASIRASSINPIQIIAVVNGSRFDDEVCDWLKEQADLQYEYDVMPSAPNAVLHGRRLVTTPYFSTLDDDDEYLVGGTDLKMQVLDASPETDLVVTNAYRLCGSEEAVIYSHLDRVPDQPLASLFEANWLHNGNALFRTASIHEVFFDNFRPYAEWTWLAYKFSLAGIRVETILQPTFRVHVTAGSLSQSDAYVDYYLPLYQSMLALTPPPEIEALIKRKMSAAWHLQSERELKRKQWGAAVRSHFRSLFLPGGVRYLSFSARLVFPGAR
jgi:hypothetical protein